MYGDVFGNRDPEVYPDISRESGSRTPTDTHTPTHVHRWQPVFEQERVTARYGYDPWTKSAFNLSNTRTRWWCWQWYNPVWHAALHYTVGSLLFVIASFAALFCTVRETPALKRWLYAYPYMVGSINYTTGATILLFKSWTNHPLKMSDPEDSVAPSYSGYCLVSQHDGPAGFPHYNSPYQDREGVTNPPSAYESTYDASTYDNVSRPPSFHSAKWWPAGDPDREYSAASMTASLHPTTITEQRSNSTATPLSLAAADAARVATSGASLEAEESQDSVTVPLLGKRDAVGGPPPPRVASHEALPPQTALPQRAPQPPLRVKVTPRATPRASCRSSAGSLQPPDGGAACSTSDTSATRTQAAALGKPAAQGSSEALSHRSTEPTAEPPIDKEPCTEKQRPAPPPSSAVAHTLTLAPGAFTAGSDELDEQRSKSSYLRDASELEASSDALSAGGGDSRGSPDQYPATPRSPRTPRSMRQGLGDDDIDREHEQGLDDDRSTMISQRTDTQSMKSYYRLFGNRWTAVSTAEQQADHEHLLTVQSRHPEQLNSLLRNYYRRDAFYYIRADPWYTRRWLLDLSGSASIFAGAMLYNVSCTCLCYEAIVGELPPLFSNKTVNDDVLSFYPSTLGGLFFIVGSWLFWWAAHQTPLLWGKWIRLYTMEWWVTFLNLVGSLGFFYGAVTGVPVGHVEGLVVNWFELVVGYVIGSVLFMVGSYLMVAELASHAASSAALTL